MEADVTAELQFSDDEIEIPKEALTEITEDFDFDEALDVLGILHPDQKAQSPPQSVLLTQTRLECPTPPPKEMERAVQQSRSDTCFQTNDNNHRSKLRPPPSYEPFVRAIAACSAYVTFNGETYFLYESGEKPTVLTGKF